MYSIAISFRDTASHSSLPVVCLINNGTTGEILLCVKALIISLLCVPLHTGHIKQNQIYRHQWYPASLNAFFLSRASFVKFEVRFGNRVFSFKLKYFSSHLITPLQLTSKSVKWCAKYDVCVREPCLLPYFHCAPHSGFSNSKQLAGQIPNPVW